MRFLGLDIGDRRIGIALSDPEAILASPFTTLIRNDDNETINAIANVVRQYEIKLIVAGMPYSLNGASSEQTYKTRAFIDKLAISISGIEITTIDERLTTVVTKRLLQAEGKKKKRRNTQLDAASAAVILQSYLDRPKDID